MLDRYLAKRPRSKFWQLRIPVPQHLRAAYGRREVTRSLGEVDRTKAAAKALPILMELKAEWQALETNSATVSHDIALSPPSAENMLALARRSYARALETAQQNRTDRHRQDRLSYDEFLVKREREYVELTRDIKAGELERWEEPTARVADNLGLDLPKDSPAFREAVSMVAISTASAIDVANRQDRGELDAQPRSDLVLNALASNDEDAELSPTLTFSALRDAYMRQWRASQKSGKETNTEQQKLATFKLFGGFTEDRPIRETTTSVAAEFYDQVRLLDPNWARSPAARKLGWHELISTYGNRPQGLSDGTMNRHMATLQSLWDWAKKRGHCTGENPFDGFHKKLKLGINVDTYLPWEPSELERLFAPPPKRQDLREIMITALYTGMRLDEIASLTANQFREESEGGEKIAFIQIDDAKTPAGLRQVPLHPDLTWLRDRSTKTTGRIWPTFNEEGKGKKAGNDASREFSRFKQARGFHDRRKAFHSFRKNVTKIMERAGIPENEWAQIFGHERGFTYSTYNPHGISLSRKLEIISQISYRSLVGASV